MLKVEDVKVGVKIIGDPLSFRKGCRATILGECYGDDVFNARMDYDPSCLIRNGDTFMAALSYWKLDSNFIPVPVVTTKPCQNCGCYNQLNNNSCWYCKRERRDFGG